MHSPIFLTQNRLVGVPARDLELLFAFMGVNSNLATVTKQQITGDELLACDDESEIAAVTGLFSLLLPFLRQSFHDIIFLDI